MYRRGQTAKVLFCRKYIGVTIIKLLHSAFYSLKGGCKLILFRWSHVLVFVAFSAPTHVISIHIYIHIVCLHSICNVDGSSVNVTLSFLGTTTIYCYGKTIFLKIGSSFFSKPILINWLSGLMLASKNRQYLSDAIHLLVSCFTDDNEVQHFEVFDRFSKLRKLNINPRRLPN